MAYQAVSLVYFFHHIFMEPTEKQKEKKRKKERKEKKSGRELYVCVCILPGR
jgi:hypothetical protein